MAAKGEESAIVLAAAKQLNAINDTIIAQTNSVSALSADLRDTHKHYGQLVAEYRMQLADKDKAIEGLKEAIAAQRADFEKQVAREIARNAEAETKQAEYAAISETVKSTIGGLAAIAVTLLPHLLPGSETEAKIKQAAASLKGLPEDIQASLPDALKALLN